MALNITEDERQYLFGLVVKDRREMVSQGDLASSFWQTLRKKLSK